MFTRRQDFPIFLLITFIFLGYILCIQAFNNGVKSSPKAEFDQLNKRFETVKATYRSLEWEYSQLTWIDLLDEIWEKRKSYVEPLLILASQTETLIATLRKQVPKDEMIGGANNNMIIKLNDLQKKLQEIISLFKPFQDSWKSYILNGLEKKFPKSKPITKLEDHLIRKMVTKCEEFRMDTPENYMKDLNNIAFRIEPLNDNINAFISKINSVDLKNDRSKRDFQHKTWEIASFVNQMQQFINNCQTSAKDAATYREDIIRDIKKVFDDSADNHNSKQWTDTNLAKFIQDFTKILEHKGSMIAGTDNKRRDTFTEILKSHEKRMSRIDKMEKKLVEARDKFNGLANTIDEEDFECIDETLVYIDATLGYLQSTRMTEAFGRRLEAFMKINKKKYSNEESLRTAQSTIDLNIKMEQDTHNQFEDDLNFIESDVDKLIASVDRLQMTNSNAVAKPLLNDMKNQYDKISENIEKTIKRNKESILGLHACMQFYPDQKN